LARDEARAWPGVRRDPHLVDFLRAAIASPELRPSAEKLVRDLRMVEFLPQLVETARRRQTPRAARIGAIETMRALQSPETLAPLEELAADPDAGVAQAAVRALATLGNDASQQRLRGLLLDGARPKELRVEVVRLLGASRSGALVILDLAEKGKLAQDL